MLKNIDFQDIWERYSIMSENNVPNDDIFIYLLNNYPFELVSELAVKVGYVFGEKMTEIIFKKEDKRPYIFECRSCGTIFKTNEYTKESNCTSNLVSIECPACKDVFRYDIGIITKDNYNLYWLQMFGKEKDESNLG